ncbi:MAG: hypothetical protein V1862_07825, partial [Methanobacteriota archaeon]
NAANTALKRMWQNHTQLTNIDPLETDLGSAAESWKFITESCQKARAANLMRDFEADVEEDQNLFHYYGL